MKNIILILSLMCTVLLSEESEQTYKYTLITKDNLSIQIKAYTDNGDVMLISKDGMNWENYPTNNINLITDISGEIIWNSANRKKTGIALKNYGMGFEFHAVPQYQLWWDISDISGYGIYLPLEIGSFTIEPYISRYLHTVTLKEATSTLTSNTTSSESKSTEFSIGLFMNKWNKNDNLKFYSGIRVGKIWDVETVDSGNSTVTTEIYPNIIMPILGAEYYFSKNFSFAGEMQYMMLHYETTSDDITTTLDLDYLLPKFIVRMYSN